MMKKEYWLGLLLILIVFLYFIPLSLLFPSKKVIDWSLFGLLFGLLPYLVFKTLGFYRITTNWRRGIAGLVVLVIAPTVGIYLHYRQTNELKENGVWVKGIVTDKKYATKKSGSEWLIKCLYTVNGKDYRTTFTHYDAEKYSVGDTLQIICSKDLPEIYELGDEFLTSQ